MWVISAEHAVFPCRSADTYLGTIHSRRPVWLDALQLVASANRPTSILGSMHGDAQLLVGVPWRSIPMP